MTPPITGADLPRLGWHHSTELDPAKFIPVTRVPPAPEVIECFTKPMPGGLWTSPVDEVGGYVCNGWVASNRHRHPGGKLWEVIPHPDATVFVIDNPADLDTALERWPDPRNSEPDDPSKLYVFWDERSDLIDWPAMAAEFDALYVTRAALSDLNRLSMSVAVPSSPHGQARPRSRHLWSWDVETVLFLQPAFTVGASYPASRKLVRGWRAAVDAIEEETAERIRSEILAETAAHGVELDPHLLQLPAMGFLMVMAAAFKKQANADG